MVTSRKTIDYNLDISFSWKKISQKDLNIINTIENRKIEFECFGVGGEGVVMVEKLHTLGGGGT